MAQEVDLDAMRQEASRLVEKDAANMVMRSCWKCNGAHEYMRKWRSVVIYCFICGHYFFRGKDITVVVDEETQ